MRFFSDAKYRFIERRRPAYVASATVLVLGLVMALVWQIGRGSWLNYGVDFRGGTMVQVSFGEQPVTDADLRSLLSAMGPDISRFGGEREFLIRVQEFAESGTNVSEVIRSILEDEYGEGGFEIVRTEAVGPKIGAELQQKALLAILASFCFTLIYLAFRFEWRFGVAAIIATVHDLLLTLGFISAFQLEVSLPTVAAVLTIIGYSLNDTIVVFDRVRENVKATGRREEYIDIINRSINEVLPRTVMTSGTTLAALLSLYLLGGAIIQDFALILILGVVVGTYSSIFIASPALLEIENRFGAAQPAHRPKRARSPARA